MMKNWEGWHFHHLARRARTFGLDEIAHLLEKAGWELTKRESIPEEIIPDLERALTKIASIRNFDKTCDRLDCEVCRRVTGFAYPQNIGSFSPPAGGMRGGFFSLLFRYTLAFLTASYSMWAVRTL